MMVRVLLVEDHVDSREALSLLLQRAGYEVNTAVNGRDALAFVIDRTPDVLLLDLALPEMDGVKLVQAIRSYHRLSSIPVVILTGLTTGNLLEEAKTLNVSSFLLKSSASMDEIRAAIRKALAHPPSGPRTHSPEKWRDDSISPL
jgi:CheY-like chemotaxis protein